MKVAFFLNLIFTIIEIVGSFWTNSIAILTDSIHDAGDTASLGLAWYFERLSKKQETPLHTYGYKRYRLLGGLITGLVLVVGLVVILWNAIGRLNDPQPVHATGMIGLALLGIVVNGYAVIRTRSGTSLTERVVSWHLLEDVLGWAAVLIGAVIMWIWDLPIVDPILSIGISLFVLWNVVRNLKEVMRVFLQTSPEGFDATEFEREVLALPGASAIHHLHSWSLDGESHVLTMHLVMAQDTTRENIVTAKKSIAALIEEEFVHLTIEVELAGEGCILPTDDCGDDSKN